MTTQEAEQRCMICRAIGFVIAALVVGLITWWLAGSVSVLLAVIAFLGLFALGLWLVIRFCGDPSVGTATAAASGAAATGTAAAVAATPASAPAAPEPAPAAEPAPAPAAAPASSPASAPTDGDVDASHAIASAQSAAAQNAARAEAGTNTTSPEAQERARSAAEIVARRARSGDDAEADAPAPKAAALASAMTGGAAAPSPSDDFDGDGIAEGTNEGTRPEALDGPRGGQADDLKQIKGVGPKLEALLNRLGFYHFEQVANWTPDEVAWVDANLEGFKGRVSRDEWVSQAKVLATGGETEFSKRVEDGDVY